MAAQTLVASATSKKSKRITSRISNHPATAVNIIFIDPERRKAKELERWKVEAREFINSLSKD